MTKRRKKDNVLVRFLRYTGFLTVNLALRHFFWVILFLLRPFKFFSYLFLVYPGSDSDLDAYCPRKLAKSWLFSCKPTLGGVISKSVGGRGLILVVPNTIAEFKADKKICEKVMDNLEKIRRIVGADSIAMAGQMPSAFVQRGLKLEKPFVRGNHGTVFCVMETIKRAAEKHNFNSDARIAVVGVGYVGSILLDALWDEGYEAIGIDIEFKSQSGVAIMEDGKALLRIADMVVVLTPRGSDFDPYVRYLKKGAVVIDDTHPKIVGFNDNGVSFYKVAVGMEGVKFLPRLPGYQDNWIPGCALEGIYSSVTGQYNGQSQKSFNKKARELGFYAHLDR